LQRQQQLESIAQAKQEADQALQDLLDIEPDLLARDDLSIADSEADQLLADSAVVADTSNRDTEDQPAEPVIMTSYDKSTGEDAEDVYKKLSSLTLKFCKNDPKFWFSNFERQIKHFGVKNQTTKLEALINLLTQEATDEVKDFIRLDEDERGATPYFDLKTELLKLYGPRPEDCFAKAISRVLVGKPSALGKQIINDFCICAKPLASPCCANIAFGIWSKNLPTYVRSHISEKVFNKDTYKEVFEMADKCWLTHRQESPAVAAIKADNATALASSTDMENPAVAAIRGRGRGARGRGNQRGGRGAQGGRGRGHRVGRQHGHRKFHWESDNPGVRHHRQRAGQYAGREAAGGGLPQPPHRYCGSQERCQAHGGLLAKDWSECARDPEQCHRPAGN